MVGHCLQFHDRGVPFGAHVADDLLEPYVHVPGDDFPPVLGAPDHVVGADAAIGAAKRELIERGMRAGRKVVLVSPAYTTMTCSECGTRTKERLGLAERTFTCTACGCIADRDRNAARVILAMAERSHAGADDVGHSLAPFQVAGGLRSEPEIPRL